MPKSTRITDEQTEQHVGRVLRARRRGLSMSQKVLAEKMQTSQEVISNYENGVTPVRADDLPRLAQILGVSPVYFFQTGIGIETVTPFVNGDEDDGRFPGEGERIEFPIHDYDALVLNVLSDADKETALLIYYRSLSRRTQTIAVRLVRELARDARESDTL